jgi:hypothetical protein
MAALMSMSAQEKGQKVDTSANRQIGAFGADFLQFGRYVSIKVSLAGGRDTLHEHSFPVFASNRRTSPVEPTPAAHIVGHGCQGCRRFGTSQADRADRQAHAAFQCCKRMLYRGSDSRAGRVPAWDVSRHWLTARLSVMHVADPTPFFQIIPVLPALIGGIRPN